MPDDTLRPLIPRAHLFGNPEKAQAKISLDGRWLAWLAPVDGILNIWMATREDPGKATPITRDTGRGIHFFLWPFNNRHLLYLQDTNGDENLHLHAVDIETRTVRNLTPFPGVRASIACYYASVRNEIGVTLNRRDPKCQDFYRLNLDTGALTLSFEDTGFVGFWPDDQFRILVAQRPRPDGGRIVQRRSSDGGWTDWFEISPEDMWNTGPVWLDSSGEVLTFKDSRNRDTAVLKRIDLATGEERMIAEDDRADIGGLIVDPVTDEPLAYSVNVERLEWRALDERVRPDIDFLESRKLGQWMVGSQSEDNRYWTVYAWSDLDSGRGLLYDRARRTLDELYEVRPLLKSAPLTRMYPVIIKSRDGLDLISYLSLPKGSDTRTQGVPDSPMPLVLVVHGGPYGRDGFGFSNGHQWLADRGYAALSVNFRGSTGFGKAFVNAAVHEWGRKMDDDLLDAVAWATGRGIADPRRVAIMGGSYGGYATLTGLTRNPDTYACGIDVFGPSNLETLLKTFPAYWDASRTRLNTAIGDPDTDEGRTLLRERSPLFKAGRIKKPLLISQGATDVRVIQAESDRMVAAMKENGIPVTYILYPDEGHGFDRPPNRMAFQAIAESFLAQHLGGRADPITREEIAASSVQVLEGADGVDGLAAALKAAGRA